MPSDRFPDESAFAKDVGKTEVRAHYEAKQRTPLRTFELNATVQTPLDCLRNGIMHVQDIKGSETTAMRKGV